jgi:hypothetical protein
LGNHTKEKLDQVTSMRLVISDHEEIPERVQTRETAAWKLSPGGWRMSDEVVDGTPFLRVPHRVRLNRQSIALLRDDSC